MHSASTAHSNDEFYFSGDLSSPLYAAPEMKNSKFSKSVDIWGSGIILFTLLLGTMKSHSLQSYKDSMKRSQAMKKVIDESSDVSADAKLFLKRLLNESAGERPSAREALAD